METRNIKVIEVPTEYKQVIAEIDEKNPENSKELTEKQLLVEILQGITEIKNAVGIVKK